MSAETRNGTELDKAATKLTELAAADAGAGALDSVLTGISGTVAAAMQSNLQQATLGAAQAPAAADGALSPDLAAAVHLPGQEAAAVSSLPKGAGRITTRETAGAVAPQAASATPETQKGETSAAKAQPLPGTESAEAAIVAAAVFPSGAAPVVTDGSAATEAETTAATLASARIGREAPVGRAGVADAIPKLQETVGAASQGTPVAAALGLQDGIPESRTEAPRALESTDPKSKERAAPAVASDDSAAEKLPAAMATAFAQTAPSQASQPVTANASSQAARQVSQHAEPPRQASTGRAQASAQSAQEPATARAASTSAGSEHNPAVADDVRAETEKHSATDTFANATPTTGQAAPFGSASAAGPVQAVASSEVAAGNTSAATRNVVDRRPGAREGTAQTAAAGKTQDQTRASMSQDVSVRLVSQSEPMTASSSRETLAESRVMAALASQASAPRAEEAQSAPPPQTADTAGVALAQARASKVANSAEVAAPKAAAAEPKTATAADADSATPTQPKSVPVAQAVTDQVASPPVTASQSTSTAGPSTEPQPRMTRLRESKEVASAKDRGDAGPQGAGAAADASVKTAEATAAPATDKVDSLSGTSSGGALSFGTTGTATTAERSASLFGGDAGAATGTHRAASPHAIAHQMSQALADAGNRTVELTLSPEELGKVRMTLHSSDGTITVAVQAERPETLDLMRRNIDSLARDFREMGYSNVGFEFGQQSDQRSSAQQQAETDSILAQAAPEREPVARFETTSIALQSSPRSASGGLDLRI
ncbi:flagellar hook-length control protein FliK [Rhodobacter viridis]|uniref:Flagellar hook-length control protein FliK n=2 Tax=Rhodobacter viridis TaxID=1054202 RepID=A0A318U386_9RHOB|nr:flagellar hook-length control protein FliK [Rhodobacter viridis]